MPWTWTRRRSPASRDRRVRHAAGRAPRGSGFAAHRPGGTWTAGPSGSPGGAPSHPPTETVDGRGGQGRVAPVESRSKGDLTSSPPTVISPTRARSSGWQQVRPKERVGPGCRTARLGGRRPPSVRPRSRTGAAAAAGDPASSSRSSAPRSASSACSCASRSARAASTTAIPAGVSRTRTPRRSLGSGCRSTKPARGEPVDAVGHRAARDEGLGDELTGAQLVGVSRAAQCRRARRTPSRRAHARRRRCRGPGRGGAPGATRGTAPRGARRRGRVAHAATRRRYGRHRQRAWADSTARQVS